SLELGEVVLGWRWHGAGQGEARGRRGGRRESGNRGVSAVVGWYRGILTVDLDRGVLVAGRVDLDGRLDGARRLVGGVGVLRLLGLGSHLLGFLRFLGLLLLLADHLWRIVLAVCAIVCVTRVQSISYRLSSTSWAIYPP